MVAGRPARDPEREAWRRALRRAAIYTYGLLVAALLVAVAGSALVALLLTRTGLPFLRTWVVLTLLVLVVVAVVVAVRALRGDADLPRGTG